MDVILSEFDGPLDLLLHLIKKSEIDIYDINIESITIQYLEYIKKFEELNLDIASEYLVMAAELLQIKSNKLLPRKNENIDEEEEYRENLINRLIEYRNYKEAMKLFKNMEEERNKIFSKDSDDLSIYVDKNIKIDEDIDVSILAEAFLNVLKTKENIKPLNTKVTTKEYSVDKRNIEIKNILIERKKVDFTELFDYHDKPYLVVTFLSILDLAKKNEIYINQEENFNSIIISIKDDVK